MSDVSDMNVIELITKINEIEKEIQQNKQNFQNLVSNYNQLFNRPSGTIASSYIDDVTAANIKDKMTNLGVICDCTCEIKPDYEQRNFFVEITLSNIKCYFNNSKVFKRTLRDMFNLDSITQKFYDHIKQDLINKLINSAEQLKNIS